MLHLIKHKQAFLVNGFLLTVSHKTFSINYSNNYKQKLQ